MIMTAPGTDAINWDAREQEVWRPELSYQYEETMAELVADHKWGAERIVDDYNSKLGQFGYESLDVGKFRQVLAEPEAALTEHCMDIAAALQRDLKWYGKEFARLLSFEGYIALESARAAAHEFGVGAPEVFDAVAQAEPDEQIIIRAALDSLVWEQARSLARTYTADAPEVFETIALASSDIIQQAMRAGLDYEVLHQATYWAREKGVESDRASDTLDAASVDVFKQAIGACLDVQAAKQVKRKGRKYGMGDPEVKPKLDVASTDRAKRLIAVYTTGRRRSERRAHEGWSAGRIVDEGILFITAMAKPFGAVRKR